MAGVVDEKSMVPTILVGVGGTGHEVLSRVRRLVEEAYGNLKNFPIISFLVIDTDRDYKVTSPESAGTPFKDNEKHWARVSGKQVKEIISNMDNFPWINSWFPNELEKNINALEAGAGQIRACGRFAFFCNYFEIQQRFEDAVRRIKGKENFMLDRYGIKVSTNAINVFITGSLSGGTGSGMMLDIGYCIRKWLQGEGSPMTTAIVPMPNAFVGINVGDRVLANGYAAMMELSYFSDHRTEYVSQFGNNLTHEVRSKLPPFDFTYLVGTKNGENDFKLDRIRETIAQNIFLDLTSDFAPHKRSIRDNIKSAWAQSDPGGRGYPKNFMSFGLSTIEIPISQIRSSLSHRLAKDLVDWWCNDAAILPADLLELVRGDLLKRLRLTESELLADLSMAQDRSYFAVIAEWVNGIRNDIANQNLLQCRQQGVNLLARETGNILTFVDVYLQPKVNAYRQDHLRELSPDERLHGDYLKKMYSNRDLLIQRGRESLESELYRILTDRTQGPKFAEAFVVTVRQIFDDAVERFRREIGQLWEPNEKNCQIQYEQALRDITESKEKFGITKQAQMDDYSEDALAGLEGSIIALIQRKVRSIALEVLARMEEHLSLLESRLNRFNQRLVQLRDAFDRQAQKDADSADALEINGIKLFDRQELNQLYQDFLEQMAGAAQGSKSRYELGLDSLCSTMSQDVLLAASPLWKDNRMADEVMQLFDLTAIPDVQEEDLKEMIFNRTKEAIIKAPESSKVKKDLAACDRLFKQYNDDTEMASNLRIAYNKSKPLILLDRAVLTGKDAGFTPALNTKAALLGGRNTSNPAAQKLIPKLQEFIQGDDNITPLGDSEQHRLVFVQETGGFSLRCIDGMKELRQSYQDWKGETIEAKRAQLRGEARELPIPVHIQKEAPFWDIFPEDPEIFKLILLARVLKILRMEENRKTKENVIRYTRKTAIGSENVDIASSWEESVQVLEVLACRDDRNAIQSQVTHRLTAAETVEQKHALFIQLKDYLERRALELDKLGGMDSQEYKREAKIILDTIGAYGLESIIEEPIVPPIGEPKKTEQTSSVQTGTNQPLTPVEPPTMLPPQPTAPNHVFCTNCGAQNPANSNFCSSCGTRLMKLGV